MTEPKYDKAPRGFVVEHHGERITAYALPDGSGISIRIDHISVAGNVISPHPDRAELTLSWAVVNEIMRGAGALMSDEMSRLRRNMAGLALQIKDYMPMEMG